MITLNDLLTIIAVGKFTAKERIIIKDRIGLNMEFSDEDLQKELGFIYKKYNLQLLPQKEIIDKYGINKEKLLQIERKLLRETGITRRKHMDILKMYLEQ